MNRFEKLEHLLQKVIRRRQLHTRFLGLSIWRLNDSVKSESCWIISLDSADESQNLSCQTCKCYSQNFNIYSNISFKFHIFLIFETLTFNKFHFHITSNILYCVFLQNIFRPNYAMRFIFDMITFITIYSAKSISFQI